MNIDWHGIIMEWQGLQHGHKEGFIKHIQNAYGVSRDKFYRKKREILGKTKTVERDTRIDRRLVRLIAETKIQGYSLAEDERELSTARCIERLKRKGYPGAEQLTVPSVNRILRQEFGFREPTPRRRWEADYALQEVQADGSHSKYFKPYRYDHQRGDWLLKRSKRALSYKQNPNRLKVILFQFQDKYSRLRLVQGWPGTNESAAIIKSQMGFWLSREEDEHMMRHVAFGLAHDNGTGFKTEEWRNLVKALGVEHERWSMPYEKTGIGAVENRWKPVWKWELEWALDYDQIWLSEYNMLLHERAIQEQYEEHPVREGRKVDLYQQSILQTPPMQFDGDLFQLASKTWIRKVSNELTVSVDNNKFKVPQYVADTHTQGKEVRVHRNLRGEWMGELVGVYHKAEFELKPHEIQSYGEYKSHKRTYRQQVESDLAKGESYYDRFVVDGGELVDPDTGEVLQPDSNQVKRLQPQAEKVEPDTIFTREPAPEEFATEFEAKAWIGRQLEPYGLSYSDVASKFDPLIADHHRQKEPIEEAVKRFLSIYSAKTGTT